LVKNTFLFYALRKTYMKMATENIGETTVLVTTALGKKDDLFSQGDILYWNCEYQKAKEHFQAVLNQPSVSPLDLARCYKSLGATNAKLQNYEEALDNYHKQLDLLMKLEAPGKSESDLAKCYMSIGMIYSLKHDYNQALNYHKQALAALSIVSTAPDLASNIYKNLANLYTKKKDFDLALTHFENALEIDHHHLREDHLKFGQTYANMGAMYYSKQDYKQALIYFEKARETWLKSLPSSQMYIESMEKTIHTVQSKLGM
jgi:tetratricopeptide (TPR) repeat protein